MLKEHSMRLAVLVAAGVLGAVGCQSTGTESMVQEEQPRAESVPAKMLVASEVVLGYMALGGVLSIISTKMGSRAGGV